MKPGVVLLALASFFFFSNPVHAELVNCNGVWTNQPCNGNARHKMKETPHVPRTPAQIANSKKDILIHDLRMLAIRARDVLDVPVSLSAVEAVCVEDSDSIEECRKAVKERSAEIELLVARHKQNTKKDDTKQIEVRTNNVTVLNNNFVDDYYGHRFPGCCNGICSNWKRCDRYFDDDRFYHRRPLLPPSRNPGFRTPSHGSSAPDRNNRGGGALWGDPYRSPWK